jgi:cytochrome c oxidase cbb3-type subunit I/II
LAREGGKQTSLWHWQHFENPTALVEGSVMPVFSHLLDTSIDFDKIGQRVRAANMLGAPYSERDLTESADVAREQAERIAADIVSQGGSVQRGDVMTFDSQAVAVIAYLQRLGTDLTAPPAPTEPAPTEPAEGEPGAVEPPAEQVASVSNPSDSTSQ